MSNQIYIPPINFNEFDNQTGLITSINAIEPLEYNKLNSQLSIKAATENNYGVITTGDQNIKGNKKFIDGLTLSTGTISSDPTKDTDITNKKYIDNKTTDLVKYNTSTNYLIDNKTNSNINTFRINNLSINNQINGSSVSVSVSTNGYHGTDTKNITVFKGYVNGLTCIIFNKNTEINSYKWVSEIPINENGIVMDFSNFSDIYSNLPQMFELKGEVSTYGGNKHIATKTLKFVKSSGYIYTLQYDKSFPMNLFKLKESIKNTDTYIFTSEANKIGTLTIDKGYLYTSPTESNNLVNKNYVDTKATTITNEFRNKDTEIISSLNSNVSLINDYIQSSKSELNENIENAKTELNGNIATAISQINTVSLSSGTLENVQNNNNSLTNKNYVDGQISKAKLELNNTIEDTKTEINTSIDNSVNNAKSELNTSINNAKAELNAKIISTINGIKNIDLTTGTISKTPTNDTDITNKKYVDNSFNSLKSYSDSNFIKYDDNTYDFYKGNNKITTINTSSLYAGLSNIAILTADNLTSTTSTISNLTSTNSTVDNVQINNKITINTNIMDLQSYGMCPIENSSGSILRLGVMYFLKIKVNNTIYLNIRLRFDPFVSDGSTLYIKNVEFSDIGSGFQDYLIYHCVLDKTYKFGRCVFNVSKNSEGKYDVEISGTANGDNIYKIDDFTCVYYLAES